MALKLEFNDDNSNPQTFGVEQETTIIFSGADQGDVHYITVVNHLGIEEEYELNTSGDGGPLMRPRRPR